ncbi:hypothetical protein [Cupriavidus sp. AU9028]|uniref:hypothetical protein n=1 Tax=Cupriavidus sp. AU9028 TaxID=2871157 RepID=UPI001C958582|nr:hypothetical protein [Cupriavidus sp. AU9028]MBY4898041.1 hypothetical protein [Cupriavidus sp. AU9028]
MPTQTTTSFADIAPLRKFLSSDEGNRQLARGTNIRLPSGCYWIQKTPDPGAVQVVALMNIDAANPANDDARLAKVNAAVSETKVVAASQPEDTTESGKAGWKPEFASVGEAKTLLRRPGGVGALVGAGGFTAGVRQFVVEMPGDGGKVRISEPSRSWLQAVLSLFRLDDGAILTRAANRHPVPRAIILEERIHSILAERESRPTGTDGDPFYLHSAIASMSMGAGTTHPADLRKMMDDPFFCHGNFKEIVQAEDPSVFKAVFQSPGKCGALRLSNQNRVKGPASSGLQGDVLRARLANSQYGSMRDLVRRWETEQLTAMLQAEVESVRRMRFPGIGDFFKGKHYRCDAMPEGYVFRVDGKLHLHCEGPPAAGAPPQRSTASAEDSSQGATP